MAGEGERRPCTFYETLGVAKTATPEELKHAYRRLAQREHPDKTAEQLREAATKRWQKIGEAYRTLREQALRARYDLQLSHRELWATAPPIINETVDLSATTQSYEAGEFHFAHPCRCGGCYSVSESDLAQDFDVVACTGCSLFIQVTYEKNEDVESGEEV